MTGSRILKFDSSAIAIASAKVREGGLIVFPTDTVYGLGCDPQNPAAVLRLFNVKRRENRPIPILCDSLETAQRLVSFNRAAGLLAKKYWPGPLTIVAPMKFPLTPKIHQGTRNLGVRVPASPPCLELIQKCGGFLTGTSANISGEPPCRTAKAAERILGQEVDHVLDGGRLSGKPSTVVQASGEDIIVLRRGPIGVTD